MAIPYALPIILDTDRYRNEMVLPPGCQIMFLPSDEQLVDYYLRRKVSSLWMPTPCPITEIADIFHHNPWDLPGGNNQMKYFFCARTPNRPCIIYTDRGYWYHDVNQDLRIVAAGTNTVVGIRKFWWFYSVENNGIQWTVMDEYSLVCAFNQVRFPQRKVKEVGDWNLYRIRIEAVSEEASYTVEEVDDEEENDDVEEENNDESESSDEANTPTSILDVDFQSLSLEEEI